METQINNIAYEARPKQAEFHAAPEMYKLYGGAMGGGKTFALCAEVIALSCDYPGNRGYICRHELSSFKKSTFITLDRMLEKSRMVIRHHQTDNYYLLNNGSMIIYGGLGDDTRAIEKLKSMELGWFAIDEASETTENFFFMLCSRLRLSLPGIRYFGLLGSNPEPGWLKHRFIDQKLDNHIFIPALPTDNPDLPEGYIDRLKEIFPDEWIKRFLEGDWTAWEGAKNIFPYKEIHAAFSRNIEAGKPIEIGVDVARSGKNETVIVLRSGSKVEILEIIKQSDLMFVSGRVAFWIGDKKPDKIKIDADGLGAGVVDRLKELGFKITEIHGGAKARNNERFANQKAEIHWGFRERLLSGDVDLPENDIELKSQLTAIEYNIKSNGAIEIVSKEDMEKKGIKSPDRAEAVIYAFAEIGAVAAVAVATWDVRPD